MSTERRETANDLVRGGQHLFGQVTTEFATAFPTIIEGVVRGIIKPMGAPDSGEDARLVSFSGATLNEYVNCRNPHCVHGGFAISNVLREMATQRQEHREGLLVCTGNEGSPKGRRPGRACMHTFSFTADVHYWSEAATD